MPLEGNISNLLAQMPFSLVVADPKRSDCPVIYVNETFERVTGYKAAEVIEQNCRFLQGQDRNQSERARLRDAIAKGEQVAVQIRNYRADGKPFLNQLVVFPLRDTGGDIFAMVGLQSEVTGSNAIAPLAADAGAELLRETNHRVKNHLAMVAAMIRMEGRHPPSDDPSRSYDLLARRVEALSLLYDVFCETGLQVDNGRAAVPAGRYVARIASTIAALGAHDGIRLRIDVDEIDLCPQKAANLGLILSELLSNTYAHAFVGRATGMVKVGFKQVAEGRIRLTVSDDGVGMQGSKWPFEGNLGAKLVVALVRAIGGELSVDSRPGQTEIRIDLTASASDHEAQS